MQINTFFLQLFRDGGVDVPEGDDIRCEVQNQLLEVQVDVEDSLPDLPAQGVDEVGGVPNEVDEDVLEVDEDVQEQIPDDLAPGIPEVPLDAVDPAVELLDLSGRLVLVPDELLPLLVDFLLLAVDLLPLGVDLLPLGVDVVV